MALPFPDIDPVALALGPFKIRWYALAYLAGFLIGWRYCRVLAARDPSGKPTPEQVDDFLSWAIAGVILGGRIGYVVFYQPDLYLADPWAVLRIWQGGMSFHGGLIGLVAALLIYSYRAKIPVLRLSDLVSCVAPIGLFFGRIANFVNGELYGRVTDVPWGIVFPYGGPDPRHPSQLYESALEGAALFAILFVAARRPGLREREGVLSGLFLAGYG
ncbi:MAG TPA: prolipoprotein diacylglyceryl transferase, partial [Alphaproteobacteria bacterium]|nr:prolipoprotein diacylglyceryl transferase [Alphaproteobacteria bacterium]